MGLDTTSRQVLTTTKFFGGQILTNSNCFDIEQNLSTITFFLFYVDSVVRNDSMARKKTYTCYVLETVQLIQKKNVSAATCWKQ